MLFLVQFSNSEWSKKISEKVGKLPLAQELFPDAEILWSREFKGRMLDFRAAKVSGHIAVATVNDETKEGTVYYFTPDGELLWKLNNKKDTRLNTIYQMGMRLSDNGETVLIQWSGDYESAENQVYSKNGELLYSDTEIGVCYQVSPEGGYLYKAFGKYVGSRWLRSRDGKSLEIEKNLQLNLPLDIRPIFHILSDDEVAVTLKKWTGWEYRQRKIRLIRATVHKTLSDKEIRDSLAALWEERQIDEKSYLGIFSLPDGMEKQVWDLGDEKLISIVPVGDYYLLFTQNDRGTFDKGDDKSFWCLFEKNGTQLWKQEQKISTVMGPTPFISVDDKHLGVFLPSGDLYLLEINSGKILMREKNETVKVRDRTSFFIESQRLILSGESRQRGDYRAYVRNLSENWNVLSKYWRRGLILEAGDYQLVGIYCSKDELGEFSVNILRKGDKNE